MDKVRMGVVGLGRRGYALLETVLECEEAKITAVCDVYEDRRNEAAEYIKEKSGIVPKLYEDYKQLIGDSEVDAVLITSSWEYHVRIATDCMKHGKIAALEVGGAYDIEDCWQLVRTYEETGTPIMLLENCCFDRFELLSESLVRAGKLGEVVNCHGAYAHDLREQILGGYVNRHYRLENYRRRNCENYPTHELGPIAKILDINRGNQFLSLVSVASKAAGLDEYARSDKNPDPSLIGIKFMQGDIVNTIITCANGETITLRLDTTLPRYYSREFTVHGTKGLCVQESNMVFLEESLNPHEFFEPEKTVGKYLNNAEQYSEYLPDEWRNISDAEKEMGHGGMDNLMYKAFFKAVINGKEMPVDVYDAAAWMSVTALSAASVAAGGTVQFFPDFTRGKWVTRKPHPVTELPGFKK